jgi:hypothetical protein
MKTRITIKRYWSDNWFYIAQIFANKPFDRWLTISVASSTEKAQKALDDYYGLYGKVSNHRSAKPIEASSSLAEASMPS